MAPEPRVWRGKVSDSGTKYFRSRLVNRNNTVLDQSSFTGNITVKVYDLDGATPETTVYSNASLEITNLVYDSLQTWDDDSVGYNFEGSVTSNNVDMKGGHTYRVCYFLTRASSSGEGVMPVMFEAKIEPAYGA